MARKGRKSTRKVNTAGSKRGSHKKGQVPLEILERRLKKLNRIVESRGGKGL